MGVLDIGNGRESWFTEGLTVEYSATAIAEICSSVRSQTAGETGGLLFGTRAGSTVRIGGFLPVPCEHALGPEFVLSPADRAGLERLVATARNEPDLKRFEAIGWYRSQAKGEVVFAEQDRDLHDRYFRYPGQIAVIFRADAKGDCTARIYAREATGAVRGCEKPFACPRPAPPPPPAPAPVTTADQSTPEPAIALPVSDELESPWRMPWKWLGAAALSLLLLAAALSVTWDYWFPQGLEPLALRAMDMDGQLFIEWDRSAKPIREGKSAMLDIFDGREKTTVKLTSAQLRQGNVSYSRQSEFVDLRMSIVRSRFNTTQEFLRFVGQPVPKRPGPLEAAAIRERLELAQQIEQLRGELRIKDAELRRLQGRN